MKLWLKQTLVTLTVILISVSLCLYFFVAKETDGLIQQAIRDGERDTTVFCDHISTLDRTSSISSGYVSLRSVIRTLAIISSEYAFALYFCRGKEKLPQAQTQPVI